MGAFGDKLRREREQRGISLDQIATSTKISTRMLKAMEEEKFDLLPGGIFNKGFVRAYAKAIGIDEEQAVADYVAASGPEESIDYLPQMADQVRPPERPPEDGAISWTMIAVLALLLVCAYAGWRFYSNRSSRTESAKPAPVSAQPVKEEAESSPPETSASAPPPPAVEKKVAPVQQPAIPAAMTSPAAAAPAVSRPNVESPAATANAPVQVVIRTTAESWILAIADGKTVLSEVVPAASEKRIAAEHRISMTVGNAAAVQLMQNGKALPELGPQGSVRNLIFTPDGFRFQSSE